MNPKNISVRIKKNARRLCIVVALMIILYLVLVITQMVSAIRGDAETPYQFWIFPTGLIVALFVIVYLSIWTLLRSIWKGETPFCAANVKRVKRIALLLICYEPLHALAIVVNQFVLLTIFKREIGIREIFLASIGGVDFLPNGGIVLAIGIAVWCIALVFEYGVALQTESDETL